MSATPVVCISGGFDPLTHGHVRLVQDAARVGEVVVILNSDAWLVRKKGYCFMPYEQRREIMEALAGVIRVEPVDDCDGTVVEALARIRPEFFANGGDRTENNTPELALCVDYGIRPLFGIGGEKVASSSELVKAAHA